MVELRNDTRPCPIEANPMNTVSRNPSQSFEILRDLSQSFAVFRNYAAICSNLTNL
jgi:hypothetical protein